MRGLLSIVAIIVAGLSAPLLALADPALSVAAPAPACTLEPGPIRTVTRVIDGETIVLDDGKAVRLIGALAPRARDAGAEPGQWPPETDAIRALSDLVLAKRVKLAFAGRRSDRYGRQLAHVFVGGPTSETWVQGALLSSGHARAYGLADSFTCARELLAHEREARRNRLGLWRNGIYRTLRSDQPGELMQQRGKYVLVTGNVVSVGRTKSASYINFGEDWRTDFTARIEKKVLSADPAFDRSLDGLSGKTIIVRGWIERRNGPLIDIIDASQVTLQSDDDSAPATAGMPQKELRPAPTEGAEPSAVNFKSL
jgi:micrococcal nuclease